MSTFAGPNWDFTNTWDMNNGNTYPYFRTTLDADLNNDGTVNMLDLSILASSWLDEWI